jgi:hypothetical protein
MGQDKFRGMILWQKLPIGLNKLIISKPGLILQRHALEFRKASQVNKCKDWL